MDFLVTDIVKDLELLRLDVENAMKNEDADKATMDELKADITEALVEVKENPQSEETLSKVCRLSMFVQNCLNDDDKELKRAETSENGQEDCIEEEYEEEEGEVSDEEAESAADESAPNTPTPRRRSTARKSQVPVPRARKKTLAMIPVLPVVVSQTANESLSGESASLRTKLEGTNKR